MRGAVGGGVIRRSEAACSVVSGKSLARPPDNLIYVELARPRGILREALIASGSARAPLSTNNLWRVYKAAVAAAGSDLDHLDLRGPHDLRHTFATWLEDAAIPSRVIDELMGHSGGRRDRGAAAAQWIASTGRRPRRCWPG